MRYTSLYTDGYVPFLNNGITSLDVTFTSDVQVVLGTNGSGKSSLMRLLTPQCLPRTPWFRDGGIRRLVCEHNGSTYVLVSDYTKPVSPHEFYKDGSDNLNEGGTSSCQEDLIHNELGITKVIRDLMTHSIKFAGMSSTPRKALLMEMNPDKIGYVFDLQKQTGSKIKSCKANLTRLNERKLHLEQDLLSANEITELKKEEERLTHELDVIQKYLFDLGVGRGSLPQVPYIDNPDEILKKIRIGLKELDRKLYRFTDISRDQDTRTARLNEIMHDIGKYRGLIVSGQENVDQRGIELHRHREALLVMEKKDERRELDQRIADVEHLLSEIPDLTPTLLVAEHELQVIEEMLPELKETLGFFLYSSTPIITTKRYRLKKDHLSYWEGMLRLGRNRVDALDQELESLQAKMRLVPTDIPTTPCAKSACPLYTSFMSSWESLDEKHTALKIKLEIYQRRVARITNYITHQQQQLTDQLPCREHLRKLSVLAQRNPILAEALRDPNILSQLSTDPIGIERKVGSVCVEIRMFYQRKKLTSELHALYASISKFKDVGEGSIERLMVFIENEERAIAAAYKQISEYEEKLRSLEREQNAIQEFDRIQITMNKYREEIEQLNQTVFVLHERKTLTRMENDLREVRATKMSRIGEISNIIRQQDILYGRYEEEVVKQIKVIEEEFAILKGIEAGLETIPKTFLIPFINDLIVQMNLLIEMIWTQPIEILPIPLDSELKTYNFPFLKYGNKVPDLSMGSEGEEELFDLVFPFALRIVLGICDYPVVLDEIGRKFDEQHKQNLIGLLNCLINDGVVSQIFLVNHHATIHEGFVNSEVLVMKEDNIVLPEKFNEHVVMV